ncbi:hypothetical protein C2E23DRAFT_764435 [Lenzites betulinus]|nr:hypothetical protein C2E23DRAFT_764435 [Lenzites betulinus]
MKETLDCWSRDPVEVITDLLGNPEFRGEQRYAPYTQLLEELAAELEGADEEEHDRVFDEMASTEWWRRLQQELSKNHPHATIAPVILASDKTQLSTLSGDKQAWPVYLTVGNIDKDVRRQPSRRAVALLGYLPVAKLECFAESERSLQGYRLFHFAMRQLLMPLREAGKDGVWMNCADGRIRHVFPILAAYIADHPEQCLVCCNRENRCPTCLVDRDRRGEMLHSIYRSPEEMLEAIANPSGEDFSKFGLRDVPEPFWADLPYANIFSCIVPDLLHQLHKGVFKNHLVKWISQGCEDELDARFARIPPYPNLRVFSKGISKITQWTGNEAREIEKVFVGLLDGLHEDPSVMICTRAILDFIYLAHYPSHTLSTLEQMRTALETFHHHKSVFIKLGIREHFNIPKLHWLNHYIVSIISFGSCDGLSTEISERLHIDFAKRAYRASNRRDFVKQMIVWLTRREKVRWFKGFLRWCDSMDGVMPPLPTSPPTIFPDEPPLHDYNYRDEGESTPISPDPDTTFGPYRIARRPGLGTHTGRALESDFAVPQFTTTLSAFLQSEGVPSSPTSPASLLERSYMVFKKFSRVLPSLRGAKSDTYADTVSAFPSVDKRPARYSTVLFVSFSQTRRIRTNYCFAGYRVGRVRLLFTLPPELQRLRVESTDPHAHLAYVELYTPFASNPEQYSKLYTIAHSYSNLIRKVAIVPVSYIFRSCHLIPRSGSRVDRAWSSDTVLDDCSSMYLNAFSDHHMYLFVE